MKKIGILLSLMLLPCLVWAQSDQKAASMLDGLLQYIPADNAIRVDFTGTENGYLLFEGDKFYLKSGSMQSWYDGKTQWTYVADNNEVNISHPTSEELEGINPYFVLKNHRTNFHSTYSGWVRKNGSGAHEIVLKPKDTTRKEVIKMYLSSDYIPNLIEVNNDGKTTFIFEVTNVNMEYVSGISAFQFNKSKFPDAEVIDLR